MDSTLTDVTFSADTDAMEVRRPDNGELVQAGDPDATVAAAHRRRAVRHDRQPGGRDLDGDDRRLRHLPARRVRLEHARPEPLPLRPGRRTRRARGCRSRSRDSRSAARPAIADAVLDGGLHDRAVRSAPAGRRTTSRTSSLAPVADEPTGEFAGTVTVPGEPFLRVRHRPGRRRPRVPARRAESHPAAERVDRRAAPAGPPSGRADDLRVHGDEPRRRRHVQPHRDGRQGLRRERGRRRRPTFPAGGSADLTVVLQPPADTAHGHVRRADRPGDERGDARARELRFLDERRSPRARGGAPPTTSTSSTTSTTNAALDHDDDRGGLHDDAPVTSSSTTTTIPCTTARCTIDAGLHGPACGDETVPPSIRKKLDRATSLIDRRRQHAEEGAAPPPAGEVRCSSSAAKAAGKAAKGKKPKLTGSAPSRSSG